MTLRFAPQMIPPLLSGISLLALAVLLWRRRSVPGAVSLTVMSVLGSCWALGYALSLGSDLLSEKIFWFNLAQVGAALVPICWLVVVLAYTGREEWLRWRRLGWVLVIPALSLLLMWTNDHHLLMRRSVHIDQVAGIGYLRIVHGPWFWVEVFFAYSLLAVSFALLVGALRRATLKAQPLILIISLLLPLFSNVLDRFGINPLAPYGPTSVVLLLSSTLLAWGLLRHRLLDLVPIARDRVVESMSDPLIVLDAQDRVLDLNRAALPLLQGLTADALGQPAAQVISCWPELAQAAQSAADDREGEVTLSIHGAERHFRVRVSQLNDHARHLGRALLLVDITAWKQAEEALCRSQADLALILDATTEMVAYYDLDLRVLWANRAAADSVEQTPDALMGRHCYEIWHGRSVPCHQCPLLRVRKTGEPQEGEITSPDGRIWYLRGYPVLGLDGQALGLIEFGQDITRSRQDEQRLRTSERRYRSLFEQVHDAVFIMDLQGAYLAANARACELLGYTADEMLQLSYRDVSTEVSESEIVLTRLLRGEIVPLHERLFRTKSGEVIPVEINIELVRDGEGRPLHIQSVARDISERKRAEEERLGLERQLLHAQKLESLGVLAGGIAHDFNNLLTIILGNLEMTRAALSSESPSHRRLDDAVQASRRAATLIRQMLAYAGKGQFLLSDVDLSDLVQVNAHLWRSVIPRTVTLRLELDHSLPPIHADAGQMQQIVMNLITNAAEAIDDDAGLVTLSTGLQMCDEALLSRSRVEVKALPGRFVWLEVSDTGCGMDQETQQRLFDPFFTTKQTGRGLGMSAVLGIVRAHRGAIVVDSTPGQGTTVRVFFPVGAEAQAALAEIPATVRRDTDAGRSAPSPSGTVLVVDDEPMVRGLCQRVVEQLGFETLPAADGQEALRLFRAHADEIVGVVLDLTMPQMDGVATFHALQRVRPDVKVLLCSGYGHHAASQVQSCQGLAGFLHKPYPIKALAQKLERILRDDAPDA
jgi:PAS domain S-box-containing protein